MSELSLQSKRYLHIFERLLTLYPRPHQKEYGPAMLQLLADQLEEAERLGDAHIRREVFAHAVFGLPGSLLREYVQVFTQRDLRQAWADAGVNQWHLTNYLFFFGITLACLIPVLRLDSNGWILLQIVAGVGAALTLLTFVFLDTRRLFLLLMVLLAGIVTEMVMGTIAVTFSFMGPTVFDKVSWISFMLYFLPPFLVAYGLVALFHAFPKRFRRPDLAAMSARELQVFEQGLQKRRRRNRRIIAVTFLTFLALNAIGLYDPPTSHADLDLSPRTLPESSNMYYELAALPEAQGREDAWQNDYDTLYLTDQWNEARANQLLTENSALVSALLVAAAKPDFQEPVFSDLTVYKTGVEAASVQLMPLDKLRLATTLALVKAEQARRNGAIDESLSYVLPVLHVGDAIASSQASVLTNLVSSTIRDEAITFLERVITRNDPSKAQLQQISDALQAVHPAKEGMARAIKSEYYLNRISLETIRGKGSVYIAPEMRWTFYNVPLMMPFLFQPNRTVSGVSEKYRVVLAQFERPCGEEQVTHTDQQEGAFPFQIGLQTLQYNGIGKQFINYGLAWDSYIAKRCLRDAKVDALQTLVSAKKVL